MKFTSILPTRSSRRAIAATFALALAACAGSSDDPATLSGVVRDPAPAVDAVALPSLTEPGASVRFTADPGTVRIVYFGFTNCPDVCPTTLADLAVAMRKLDPEQAEKVDVVMVTVDPDRDLELLDGYITSFIPDGIAAGTDDVDTLVSAAEPFGASWEVRALDDGTVEVDHSPFLYAVDDAGQLVLTWQFGATSDDLASDIDVLLSRYVA